MIGEKIFIHGTDAMGENDLISDTIIGPIAVGFLVDPQGFTVPGKNHLIVGLMFFIKVIDHIISLCFDAASHNI